MLRPKSSSGGRSFLDELLGDDGFGDGLSPGTSNASAAAGSSLTGNIASSARQRKSVRFFEDDESDSQTRPTSRPHSSTLESLLNSGDVRPMNSGPVSGSGLTALGGSQSSTTVGTIKQPQQKQQRASSADWLGLSTTMTTSESETEEKSKTNKKPETSTMSTNRAVSSGIVAATPKTTGRRPSTSITLSTSTSSNSSADWITTGSGNRQRTDGQPVWQPKIFDSTIPRSAETTASIGPETRAQLESQVSDSQITQTLPLAAKSDTLTTISLSNISSGPANDSRKYALQSQPEENMKDYSQENTLHHTKVRMLDMEKEFLERTIEQMKTNHANEIKSMMEIYEQQMRMTSEMYRRHEQMIQEERDKRLEEMKRQVELGESDLDHHKQSSETRLQRLEEEWRTNLDRIREQNRIKIDELQREHNMELERLRARYETRTDSIVNTSADILTRKSDNITQLLSKWEDSAVKIEQLQRSVLAHQQTLSRPEIFEPLTAKFTEIEVAWKQFFADYPNYVTRLDDTLRNEREQLFRNAQERTEAELKKLQDDRTQLEDARVAFAKEVTDWRRREADSVAIHQTQRDKLKQDIILFEERRRALESLYDERKRYQEEEHKRIELQFQQIQTDRKMLEDERAALRTERSQIDKERTKLNAIRQEFETEKEQLARIAQTLSIKAEDLEKLSQVALKEKMDGIKSIEEAELVQKDIQFNLDEIQRSRIKILEDERRLALERARLAQNWSMIKEFGESAVCNLCGTSLNYVSNSVNFSIASITTNRQMNGSAAAPATEPIFSSLISSRRRLGQSLMGIDEMESSQLNSYDTDKAMMQLKMDSQRDEVLLQEETNFVKALRRAKTAAIL